MLLENYEFFQDKIESIGCTMRKSNFYKGSDWQCKVRSMDKKLNPELEGKIKVWGWT